MLDAGDSGYKKGMGCLLEEAEKVSDKGRRNPLCFDRVERLDSPVISLGGTKPVGIKPDLQTLTFLIF